MSLIRSLPEWYSGTKTEGGLMSCILKLLLLVWRLCWITLCNEVTHSIFITQCDVTFKRPKQHVETCRICKYCKTRILCDSWNGKPSFHLPITCPCDIARRTSPFRQPTLRQIRYSTQHSASQRCVTAPSLAHHNQTSTAAWQTVSQSRHLKSLLSAEIP